MTRTLPTILLLASALVVEARESNSPDVLIYGATPAGIAAALAAAEGDRKVMLIEPTARIGGLTTHGLSHSDFHSFESLHGPFLQFSQRVLQHYRKTYGEDSEQVRDSWRGTHGEPSVNLMIFEKMLAEKPTITVLKEHRLIDVTTENQSISASRFSLPDKTTITIRARLFIDASYEGDLLAAAGVPYRVGREARSEYGESLAPETADDELQGYNFRLCMTQKPENRIPIPVPENYRREDYAALVPLVKAGKFRSAFGYPGRPFVFKAHLPILPNGKHDINDVSKGLVRLSLPGHNREYPDGDLATRRRIMQEHLDWQFGLIHFVQTDPALPEDFRQEAATWGLCRDEFTDTDHIPPQIYVREARRMVGLRVYTQADTRYTPNDARARLHPDSIALGEYSHNCHGTGHEGPKIGGKHNGEFYKGVAPYQIPYGVIVPKKLRNLLAPVACSASHVGFCALRLEPIWMSLGGAAGHAADLALDANVPVQQVKVEALQRRIWSAGGATIHVSDVPPDHPDFIAVQWWAGLGGLHGIEPAPRRPGARGKHIVSQYFEAFPGNAAKLDQPLEAGLRKRWTELAKIHNLSIPAKSNTRGDWIRSVFAAMAPSFESKRFTLPNGHQMNCHRRPGNGPTLVLIPGTWGDLQTFAPLIAALPREQPIAVIELCWHGGNVPPRLNLSIEQLADDVLRIIKKSQLQNFFISGHSIGGMIAVEITGRQDLPGLLGTIPLEGWTHHTVAKNAFGGVVTAGLTPRQAARRQANRDHAQAHLNVQQKKAIVSIWRRWNGATALQQSTIPILHVWGDRNRPRPDRQALQIPERPSIELAWVPGSSHSLLIQAPETTARLIEDFIRVHR